MTDSKKKDGFGGSTRALVVFAVIIIIGVVWLLSANNKSNFSAKNGGSNSNLELSESVLAIVNNEPILKEDFDKEILVARRNLEGQGLDFNNDDGKSLKALKEQTLVNMINQRLVLQAALANGVVLDDAELIDQVKQIKERFGSEEEFNSELEKVGLTLEQLEENVKRDILIQKYLDSVTSPDSIVATEEDMKTLYADVIQNTKEQEGDKGEVPPYNDVKEALANQVKSEKVRLEIQKVIEKLRKEGVIRSVSEFK